jgi:hypothetical protein
MELEGAPRMKEPVKVTPVQETTGMRPSRDTLMKADRLEIPQFKARPQPLSSSELVHPPDHIAFIAQAPSKIIEQQKLSANTKSAIMLPRPRPRYGTSKAIIGASRAKPVAEAKPCPSVAFDGLFKALNLQMRCQT